MDVAVLIARFGLAALLAVAGIGKIANLKRTRDTLAEFGVGPSWIPTLTVLLPISELITAAALLWEPISWYGAVAALVLFLIFTAGMAYNLALGRRPECNCFGQLQSQRIGNRTLIRNLLFALVAIIVILHANAPIAAGLSIETRLILLVILVFGTAMIVLARLVVESVRQGEYLGTRLDELEEFLSSETFQGPASRESLLANEHLPLGTPAPEFALTTLDGEHHTRADLLAAGKPLLIFFLSSDCSPCTALIPEIDLWQSELRDRFAFAIISRGSVESNREKFAKATRRVARPGEHSPGVLVDESAEVANEFRAKWTPAAILITPAGAIGSEVAFGDQQIKALLDRLIVSDDDEPWIAEGQNVNSAH